MRLEMVLVIFALILAIVAMTMVRGGHGGLCEHRKGGEICQH